ncbi:MAG: hypothetical protein JSV91_06685 [Phycisphaerales bacterium]|nr:MAG: hypothetical protein JSV91_06685 [Phycisphaerales bacterium]
MNWRWLSIPRELELTKQQRRKATKAAWPHIFRHPLFIPAMAIWLAAVFVVPHTLGSWLDEWARGQSVPAVWSKLLAIGAVGIVSLAVFTWMYAILFVRSIRLTLRDMGYEICVRCGYWLRGLGDDLTRCPECGAKQETAARGKEASS